MEAATYMLYLLIPSYTRWTVAAITLTGSSESSPILSFKPEQQEVFEVDSHAGTGSILISPSLH